MAKFFISFLRRASNLNGSCDGIIFKEVGEIVTQRPITRNQFEKNGVRLFAKKRRVSRIPTRAILDLTEEGRRIRRASII